MGQRVAAAREAAGYQTGELADLLDAEPLLITKMEAGKGPSMFLILTLCKILKITPEYILNGSLRGLDPETRERLLARAENRAKRMAELHAAVRQRAAEQGTDQTRYMQQRAIAMARGRRRKKQAQPVREAP